MTVDRAVELVRSALDAYPTDVFPTPPDYARARNAAAADVMRRVAYPILREILDEPTLHDG